MPKHTRQQAALMGIALSMLLASGCSITIKAEHQGREHAAIEACDHADWQTLSKDMPKRDRMTFSPQPTPEQLHAFADAGGQVVINARTEPEMQRVEFDERALVESLGMEYVRMPTSAAIFGDTQSNLLNDTLASTTGPVLAHCASGSRAATIYGLMLVRHQHMDKNDAIQEALALGMSPKSARLIERTLMEIPSRVIKEVDPAEIRRSIDTLVAFGTRHTLSDTESATRGIGAARRWVKHQFEQNIQGHNKAGDAAPRVYFDAHQVEPDGRRITQPVEVVNVVCEIPGINPETRARKYYVLGHLDSRASGANDSTSDAPGANDDGSGVALMIELARVLSREPLESTVVLVATSGEEQGLFGARLHAQSALDAGTDIRAVLNNDTVGDPRGVLEGQDGRKEIRVFSEGVPATLLSDDEPQLASQLRRLRLYATEADSDSRQIARYIAEIADLHKTTVQPRLIHRPDRFLRGGDHTPFNELGFPAIRFCETYENYDHQHQDVRIEDGTQYGDLPEFVDEEYLADVTRLNAAVLVHLANAPSKPANTRVIIAELTNDTTLRWDPSPETDVAGYEIVWRATTDPQWEHHKDVGNTTEGSVPLSKDNWFFGVRSYDHDGYRSPVSYPRPARE